MGSVLQSAAVRRRFPVFREVPQHCTSNTMWNQPTRNGMIESYSIECIMLMTHCERGKFTIPRSPQRGRGHNSPRAGAHNGTVCRSHNGTTSPSVPGRTREQEDASFHSSSLGSLLCVVRSQAAVRPSASSVPEHSRLLFCNSGQPELAPLQRTHRRTR